MKSAQSLEQIQPVWFSKIAAGLFSDERIKQSFLEQANHFYDGLIIAVHKNDPSSLEPILLEWINNSSQSDLINRESVLAPIVNSIFMFIFEIAREIFADGELVDLFYNLLPIYSFATNFIFLHEIEHIIRRVLSEAEQINENSSMVNQTKTEFVSVAAHELKTPLTLLKGYTTMLQELLRVTDVQEQAEIYLHGIEVGYSRLLEIVNDLIDISMIDNNILPIVFQPLWIHQLFSAIKLEIADISQDRNLSITFHNFQGSEEMTYGDGERLLQAFRKLVFNAIKYTPDGGRVVVDGRPLPGYVEITIKDTGIGIDPKDHLRIFEKFGHLGNPSLHSSGKTKFKGGGPGLGLSITKGIIEAHGGAIWVESDGYNEDTCPGSTFHVLLPMRKELPNDKTTLSSRLVSIDINDHS